jgi:hypothetical protein
MDKQLLNEIYENIEWADDQNEKVFNGHSQPTNYMESLKPEIMEKLQNLNREQLLTIIINFRIMRDDIMQLLIDQLEDDEE